MTKSHNGLFITFEGIDGCGKSTQVKRAFERLQQEGFDVVVTREPGGTPIAEKIREILISPQNSEMVSNCEVLLYMAARAQHVEEKIIPLLQKGVIILCDRFHDATIAYQGYGRGLPLETLNTLGNYVVPKGIPHLTFLFDLPVEISRQRLESISKGKDRLEQNGNEFFSKIRDGYLSLAKSNDNRFCTLDATLPIDHLAESVYQSIMKKL